FEALWQGQTPGKKLLGIRAMRDGGIPIDFTSALVRNLIRVGEASLGFYALSAISTLLSPENKRLGDYAAGTIVVRDLPPLQAVRFDVSAF
ncbi:MAG: RDD family protein, partial [Candidatus Eremiobacteraeota bacterium]|nr:RDD family protein [Candidatus Eremiobacteraeota bacterium]